MVITVFTSSSVSLTYWVVLFNSSVNNIMTLKVHVLVLPRETCLVHGASGIEANLHVLVDNAIRQCEI